MNLFRFTRCAMAALLVLLPSSVLAQPPASDQLPTGGTLTGGQATIAQSAGTMEINQSSNRAAIDWQSFNVGSSAQVNFVQPSSNSVILNRVVGANASQIFGQINANGQVFLSNPGGVTFAPGASVNVGGLVATTLDIDHEDFMAGINRFIRNGTTASVVNEGIIRVADYAALLAPEVRNDGVILAQNRGTVALASGDVIELQINSSGSLLDIQVSAASVATMISNGGAVEAPGGLIILSANAASELMASVIRNDGTLSASSMVERGGRIFLEGDDITLGAESEIVATGATGGGEILVGGDWKGSGDMRQATRITMAQGAKIDASAVNSGDGGKVVLWSDVTNADSVTIAKGEILARGGQQSGDGGQIETSGYTIDTGGIQVNAGADNGTGGLWLIDPTDATINQFIADGYVTTLNTGTSVLNEVTGSITLSDNVLINKTAGGNASLTFKATDNIALGAGSEITSTSGELNVVLWAAADNSGELQVNNTITTNGGDVWMGGGNGSTTWNGLTVGDGAVIPLTNGAANGIGLTGAAITTTGGNLYMAGTSYTQNASTGVAIEGGTAISTGVGNIDITGSSFVTLTTNGWNYGIFVDNASINATTGNINLSGDLQGTYNNGIGLSLWSLAGDVSIESTSGNITLTGSGTDSAGTGNGWRHGIILNAIGAGSDILVKSSSGKITLDGTASFLNSASDDTSGTQFQMGSATSTINVVSQTGDIDIKGRNAEDGGANNAAIRFTAQDVAGNFNIGYDGTNAYSGNILIQGDRIYQRNSNGGSGSIRVQSTGALTIESEGAGFSQAFTLDDDWNFGTTLSTLTVGKSTNTADVFLSDDITTAGAMTFYGRDMRLANTLETTSVNADIKLLASRDIYSDDALNTPASFITNGGNILLASDTDGVNGGQIDFRRGFSATSNGGDITLGGGDFSGSGYAQGYNSANAEGIRFQQTPMEVNSGGGNIVFRGKSFAGSVASGNLAAGISFWGNTVKSFDSGTGTILFDGVGQSNGSNYGFGFVSQGTTTIQSANTTADAIKIIGDANASTSGINDGLRLQNNTKIYATALDGGITLEGNGGSGNNDFILYDAVEILAKSGPINIVGKSANGVLNTNTNNVYIGSKVGENGDASSSDVTITVDNYNFNSTNPNINTSGVFTWESVSASFGSNINASWLNYNTTLGQTFSGINIGKTTNTADVTINNALSATGAINIYAGNINLNDSLTSSGGAVLAKATGNIITNGNDITTSGDITLWSDSDASGLGYISLAANSDLTSNGGNITLSGGAGLTTGYASANNTSGVLIGSNLTINSNGGDILVRGYSDDFGGIAAGVDVSTGVNLLSGTGAIGLYGRTDNSGSYGVNIATSTAAGVSIESAKTSGDAIVIDGYSSTSYGVTFNYDVNKQVLATGGGNIAIKGEATTADYGISLSDIDFLASTGTITLDGGARGILSAGSNPGAIIGYKAGSAITASSSDINIISDIIDFGSYTRLQSSGALNIRASTAATTVGLAGGVGTLNLDATELGYLQDGFSSITLGDSTAGEMNVSAYTFNDDVILRTGNGFTMNGAIATNGDDISLYTGQALISQNITAAGGNIVINATATAADNRGLQISGANITTTGMGNIAIIGDATAATADNNGYGIDFISTNSIIETAAGDITLTGTGTSNAGSSNSRGIAIQTSGSEIRSASGAITITEVNPNKSGGYSGLYIAAGNKIGQGSLGSSSSDITIEGDNQNFGSALIQSTGNLTVKAGTVGTTIGLAGGAGTLNLTATELAAFQNGFSSITIGDSAAGLITANGYTFTDNLTLQSGSGGINLAGAINVGANELTLNSSGSVIQSAAITAGGLELLGSGSFTLANVGNNIATLAANSGSINYVDSDAVTIGTVNTVGITATGAVSIATESGNLTVSENITTTDVSASALLLNAGRSTAAGTTSGGNILISGSPTLTVGSGGRTTLYSGSIADSIGLTSLVGAGSGRFRYNSDESASNFTSALGTGNYAIYREQPTLTINADDETVTYGTAPTLATSVSGINGDTALQALSSAATVSVSGGMSTTGNYTAGSKTLTASSAIDQLGYGLAYTTGTLTVNQKALTATYVGDNKVYDGTTVATVNGSSVDIISGDLITFSNTTASFADKNAGTNKTVSVGGIAIAGADAGNYTLTSTTASDTTVDITPKAITVLGIAANNKVYDANDTAILNDSGVAFGGMIVGDALLLSSVTGTFSDKNAATSKTVTLASTYGGGDVGNYTFTDQTTATADITPKALTAAYVGDNKVYDGATTATVTGSSVDIIGSDTVTFSNTTASFADKNVGTNKTVSVGGIAITGTDAGNYTLTSTTASDTTVDITPKAITVSGIAANNKVYDANNMATVDSIGVAFGGIIGGDDLTLSSFSGTFSDKNAATGKTVILASTYGGDDVGNYTFTDQTTTTADITPKALTATYVGDNKVYDGTTVATVSVSSADIISGDAITFSNITANFSDRNVGTNKTVLVGGIAIAGTDAGNYTLTATTASDTTVDITPKAIIVSGISANNKIYDANDTAIVDGSGVAFGGIIGGDDLTLASFSGTFSDKNAATSKTITLASTYGGADVGNYTFTDQATTTADITPKNLTAAYVGTNKVYDGTTVATVSGSSADIISGDAITFSNSAASFADRNAGTNKTVSVGGIAIAGTDAGNYTLTSTTASDTTVDITPKAITVSGIAANNKVYDANDTAILNDSGVAFGGMIVGDALLLSSVTGTFNDKNVATGKVVTLVSAYGGSDVGNYSFTDQATTTADITPKSVAVTGLTAANKIYDGNAVAVTNSTGVSFSGIISGDGLTLASLSGTFNDKNAATDKTITLTSTYGGDDVGNYTFTDQVTTTADITPKALTAAYVGDNKVYDGTTVASVNGSSVDIIGSDTVTFSNTTANFADKNVGTNKTVSVGGIAITGTDAGNYTLTATTASDITVDITPKAITVSGIAANNKVYDANDTAIVDGSGVAFGGIIGGDDLTLASFSGTFSDKNAATGKTVALASTYGGDDVGNYTFTDQATTTADITPKDLTAAYVGDNKVYDGTTVATVSGSSADIISGDIITFSNSAASFADKNAGSNKTVSVSGITIAGMDAGNYTLTATTASDTTVDIIPKTLTVSGITAADKVYDANTSAVVDDSSVAFGGIIGGDDLNLASLSGTFSDENVGSEKTVSLNSSYSGADVGNYSITDQLTTTADILPVVPFDPEPSTDAAVVVILPLAATFDSGQLVAATTDFSQYSALKSEVAQYRRENFSGLLEITGFFEPQSSDEMGLNCTESKTGTCVEIDQ